MKTRYLLSMIGLFCVTTGIAQTFTVSNNGNTSYNVNGMANPSLTLQRGNTYTFQVSASGHPFFIKTARGSGNGNQFNTGVSNNGDDSGTVTFTVPVSAPNPLFYQCGQHDAMGGTLNIINGNAVPSVTLTNPVNGAVFFAPANLTLQATASDTDGTVTNVQFRVGTAVVGNDATIPYSAVTNGLVAGSFTLSAVASDNGNARATNSVNIIVDAFPSVTLTNPLNGALLVAPANLTIQATASDSDGTVTNVQFLIGSAIVGNDTTLPYAGVTNGVTSGNFTLTAIASDNHGARSTNMVNIIVNAPPSVTVTNPLDGALFVAPANVNIQATATDPDGTVTNVQFLVGSALVANDTTAPYAAATNGLAAGNFTLSAIAADNRGTRATNTVNIIVNAPPSVTVTNPSNGALFVAPANVLIEANAADADGSVTNVAFLVGSAVVGNDSTSPYSAVTNNLPEGNYALSAVASDNRGTRTTNSINITVNAAPNTPPTVRIVFVSVGDFVTVKSTGTNGWSAVPEFNCTMTISNWTVVPSYTNAFANNTNTTTFERLEAVCGSTNAFIRIRNSKD